MNCSECEQLFDAYLDGQLGGSLRLEFDAHRLRCRRCQQTLAMLETIGHVVAAEPQVPELSVHFTDCVMQRIQPQQRMPRRTLRVAIVAGAALQAAAVLAFAILWNVHTPGSTPSVRSSGPALVSVPPSAEPGRKAIHALIVDGVEDQLWNMHAAGTQLTADVVNLAKYLNLTLPDDIVRDSVKMAGVNPWAGFWNAALPPNDEGPKPAPSSDGVHSL